MNTAQTIVLVVSILSLVVGALLIIGLLAESAKARKEEEKNAPQKVGWYARKTPTEKRQFDIVFACLVFLAVMVLIMVGLAMQDEGPSRASYGSATNRSGLSEATKRKIFYDLVDMQDVNPYSDDWNKSAKKAMADAYDISESELNSIIHEGATERWRTPPPP